MAAGGSPDLIHVNKPPLLRCNLTQINNAVRLSARNARAQKSFCAEKGKNK
jgi:hypothetical protein